MGLRPRLPLLLCVSKEVEMAIQALEQAPDTVLVKCARRAGKWMQAAMLRTREGGFARRARTSAPVLVQQADTIEDGLRREASAIKSMIALAGRPYDPELIRQAGVRLALISHDVSRLERARTQTRTPC